MARGAEPIPTAANANANAGASTSANANINVNAPANTGTNLTFSSLSEALGMLFQAMGNLGAIVQQKDLGAIHQEDMVVSASLVALQLQAGKLEPELRARFSTDVTQFGWQLVQLHIAGDAGFQDRAETALGTLQSTFDRLQTLFPSKTLAEAQEAASVHTCPAHRDIRGRRSDTCPKCGSSLEQQVRLLPAFCGVPLPATQTISIAAATDQPLTPGQPATVRLKLAKADGSPANLVDFMLTHTERIHLLIIDSSLTDYHHEHPRPTRVPGEFSFAFTPHQPGAYLLWADVRPYPIGQQEYLTATLPGAAQSDALSHRGATNKVEVDGLIYELIFASDRLSAERPVLGRLRITKPDGTPFTQLEPLMGAFIHLVGFYEDRKSILHSHSRGAPVLDPRQRGGPEVEFQFYPAKAGWVRLFAQVQTEGASRVAPFAVQIGR